MEDDEFGDDNVPETLTTLQRVGLWLGVLALVVAVGLVIRKFMTAPAGKSSGVHEIALIKQPPPPPPPKPPEKPPEEPPKVKEEIKVDQPKDEPKPAESKQPDDKPASDKPLGVDAEGTAGSDGFGLAGSKGGRDLLTTGGGGGGSYYSGLLQRQFFNALSRNRKILAEQFRVVVKISIDAAGKVSRADIVNGSGNAEVDQAIQLTLMEMPPLGEVPPSAYREIEIRLSNRA